MRQALLFWLQVSRPRFWLYLLGPALLGLAGGLAIIGSPKLLGGPTLFLLGTVLLWATYPLNLLLYGVNDYYDADTDVLNPKKRGKEVLLGVGRRPLMRWLLLVCGAASGLIGLLLPPIAQFPWYLLLFLGWSYSAPPLRWKERFWLDAYSNVLYVLPAWVTYGLITGQWLSSWWLVVGLCWSAGMHTFSAIPDIAADAKALVRTTAVRLGERGALLFVGVNWVAAALIAIWLGGPFASILMVYPALILIARSGWRPIAQLYWWFPLINGLLGFIAFWLILLVG